MLWSKGGAAVLMGGTVVLLLIGAGQGRFLGSSDIQAETHRREGLTCEKGGPGGGNSRCKDPEWGGGPCAGVRSGAGRGGGQRVTAEDGDGSCAGPCRPSLAFYPEREGSHGRVSKGTGQNRQTGLEALAKIQGDGLGRDRSGLILHLF